MPNPGGAIFDNTITLLPRLCRVHTALVLTLLLSSGIVYSAEWDNKAGATASAVFTDNVYQTESNEKSDLIPVISPFWDISGKGGGLTLDISGSFDVKDPGGKQSENNLNLLANAKAEVIDRILFLDAKASSFQNAINPLSTSGSNSLGKSDNRTTTETVTLSPYVIGRIKNHANFRALYTYSYVTSSEIDNGDTRSGDLNLALNSGPSFGRFLWGANASDRTTDAQTGESTGKSSISANLGYQLTRAWQVNGLVGREWTDYTSNGNTGGMNWELGAIWTPSVRTSVNVGYGRRFSGPTGHLNLSHRSRRSLFTASYSQEVTDNSEQLSKYDSLGFIQAFNSWYQEATGNNPYPEKSDFSNQQDYQEAQDNWTQNAIAENALPSQSDFLSNIDNNAQFLSDRFALGYFLRGKRTTLSVNGNYTKQTAGNASETIGTGMNVRITRNISGRLSATAGLSLDRIKQNNGNKSDLWDLNLGLSRKLTERTTLDFKIVHAKRDSDTANDSYDENRIGLSLKHYLR
jgi:uncharacterized protein (PEP-CTERM system associated)